MMTSAMSSHGKTAIICMGGGMRSAYSAGFLYALATKLKLAPDIIIGTSGNAGNVLYYAAGQYESAKRVWCNLIATRKFISPWRVWKILDIDYLIDTIFKKQEPLNVEALATTSVEWYVPITDAESGETRYVSAEDHADPFELLRAAKATPFFFGKKVSLFGRMFIDGEVGPTLEDHVAFVTKKDADRILIINNGSDHSRVMDFLKRLYAELEPSPLREKMLHDMPGDHMCATGPEGTKIICIFPGPLPARFSTVDKKALAATLELGEQKAIALEQELRTLLS